MVSACWDEYDDGDMTMDAMYESDKSFFEALAERWQQTKEWSDVCRAHLDGAKKGRCHENAVKYVAMYGGAVVQGFVFLNYQDWNVVDVIPHSIVRLDGQFLDPTPNEVQPTALPFIEHDDLSLDFNALVKRHKSWRISIGSQLPVDPPMLNTAPIDEDSLGNDMF